MKSFIQQNKGGLIAVAVIGIIYLVWSQTNKKQEINLQQTQQNNK